MQRNVDIVFKCRIIQVVNIDRETGGIIQMTVFRVHKNENYTVLSNYHFKEKEMSLKAKGLLSLMLSLPDNWDYSAAGLVKLSKDGKDSVNAALKELETFGYLKRSQAVNANGTFGGYNYEIYESPNADIKTEKPKTKKAKSGCRLKQTASKRLSFILLTDDGR